MRILSTILVHPTNNRFIGGQEIENVTQGQYENTNCSTYSSYTHLFW